jgi:LysR family transcriptional regulator of gallate degradation
MINLRHLRAFIAVAELGGTRKAADSLFRAQSAVTRSVQELEATFGVALFERKTAGMLPTAFGNTLLFRAKRAVQELELARDEMSSKAIARGTSPNASPNASINSALFNERRLIIFLKLAEFQRMQSVAHLLGMTQPAVSASMKKLEAGLGVPLFRRTPTGVLLTEAGEVLLLRTRRALAELRHVQTELGMLSGTMEGRVTVGVLPLGRTYILPRAIGKAISAHPGLQISSIEGSFDTLETGLRAGDIDFMLGALRPADYASDLVGEPLLTDKTVVFARRDHPLTRLSRISINNLVEAKWILPIEGSASRKAFDSLFISLKRDPPKAAVETNELAIRRDLLLNSDMVTVASLQWFYKELMSAELQVIDFDLKNTARMIGITQRQKSYPSPGAVALMEAIRQVVREMGRA